MWHKNLVQSLIEPKGYFGEMQLAETLNITVVKAKTASYPTCPPVLFPIPAEHCWFSLPLTAVNGLHLASQV